MPLGGIATAVGSAARWYTAVATAVGSGRYSCIHAWCQKISLFHLISKWNHRISRWNLFQVTHFRRAGRLELLVELFSIFCSHEIVTDQSYHACIRSEKIHPSDPMHAWLQITATPSQPWSGRWPASPVKLTAIYIWLRAHIKDQTTAARSGPMVSVWRCSRLIFYSMCTPIMHSTRSKHTYMYRYVKMALFPLILTGPLSLWDVSGRTHCYMCQHI